MTLGSNRSSAKRAPKSNLKYLKAKQEILLFLTSNRYEAGSKIPTEQELGELLGYSRTTIRLALDSLNQEQVITKRQGSGSFLRQLPNSSSNTTQTKGLIGMINFFNLFYIYPEIVQGVEETLAQLGYYLLVTNCNLDSQREAQAITDLVAQGVKGLLIEPSSSKELDQDHPLHQLLTNPRIPVVATNWGLDLPNLPSVSINDFKAGYQAGQYLIQKGHKKLAMVYKSDVESGQKRAQGFFQGAKDLGIDEADIVMLSYDREDEALDLRQSARLTKHLLDTTNTQTRPTAIFYFNDDTAIQGYQALAEAGLRVGEDLSVLGFDNYKTSGALQPPLTTFDHPKYALGKWAARLLVERIEQGHNLVPTNILFEPRLVERQSVKDLNS